MTHASFDTTTTSVSLAGKDVWSAHGKNDSNQTAVSVDNCRVLKAAGKASRCFIYHNLELALEWEEGSYEYDSILLLSGTFIV